MMTRLFRIATLGPLLCLLCAATPASEQKPEPPKCLVCSNAIAAENRVVVTDFASKTDIPMCGVWCAMRGMAEKYPASRAVAHSPVSGKEIRIIRTGVRWVVAPESAVFLILDDPKLPPTERWRVFDRQAGYVQFLSRHRELLKYNPRPMRIAEVVRLLTAPPPKAKR
jgi:hypothetical protein